MGHRIAMAIVCLHISAVLYILVGVLALWFFLSTDDTGAGMVFGVGTLILCLALAAGIEFVVVGLRRRKLWAWIAGLCVFGIYLPSLFLPLGAFGLWGLLDGGSRKEFGVGGTGGSH